ncbi:D-alanyl-D-alanine carboxypeptidase/D-alanyl-D-alanine endopeptidase [Capillimicrobium parvum]|uniref:D-alanyl-D-alanine carboxypeptidase n=1 Tax=Capillimicrobium parvum TaxID=2884022 RepID=A0A9E6XZM2_9ACTN|nr:D-alanyl-D-alanine carboxypeptidase/D-alanyl-D-alanine-endopeptidase [Capillimicrobium parvum]UGS37256.1 D-alanyl-D-alanine carboxypeptidase [Capillimicrobium parvum]
MRPSWHNGRIAGLACVAACGALASSASAATGPVPGLDPAALEVMNQPAYANGEWFISVRDLDTGAPLISLNADTLVEPGSVVKTYSMGAGWQQFGPDHRVVTPVKRSGRLTGGRLRGNLILVGQGDMTMGGRTKPNGDVDFTNLDHNDANDLPGATLTPENPLAGLDQLAQQVRASGVRRVSGDVIVDDRLFETFHLENGPVTPIIINNNLIDFTTTPRGVGRTAKVVMRPVVAPWKVTSQVRTVAAGGTTKIKVTSPAHGRVVLTGTIAADSDPAVNTYAFEDPARYARTAFIEALRGAGVKVKANAVAANPVRLLPSKRAVTALPAVARLQSLSLDQEATYVLKVSYNRGAQTMICLLAVAAGSTKCDDGLAKAQQIWSAAGLDTDGAVLIDGSGLTGNLITADNQVQLQTIMARRPDAAAWQATLPIMGVDGSLALVQPGGPASGKIFAKTGTLASGDLFNDRILFPAKALGGYIDARSGRRLAFAIVAANSVFTTIEGAFAANDDVGKVATLIQQGY